MNPGTLAAIYTNVAISNADVLKTKANVTATNADVVKTQADAIATNSDRIQTIANKEITNADVLITNADRIQTGLDRANILLNKTEINNRYYGALSADPVLRPNGEAMQAGDEYFSTSLSRKRVFNGVNWTTPDVDAADSAATASAAVATIDETLLVFSTKLIETQAMIAQYHPIV